jgi:hypothetical protein
MKGLRGAAFPLACAVVACAWALRLHAFFATLPGNDFLGDLGIAEEVHRHLLRGELLPPWTALDALGRPTTAQSSTLLLFLPVALAKFLVGDTVLAAKLWLALLHTAAPLSLYGLARRLSMGRAAALVGAGAYLLAPLHLFELSQAGHWQLAVSFALSPWFASRALVCMRAPDGRGVAVLGLVAGWFFLADPERACTFLPVLVALVATDAACRGARPHDVVRGASSAFAGLALGALLSAGLSLPMFVESGDLNLLRPVVAYPLFPTHEKLQLFHPLFAIDGGVCLHPWFGLSPVGANGVQGGWLWVVGGLVAVPLAEGPRRVLARGLVAALGVALWLAGGDLSWARRTLLLFPQAPWVGAALLAAVLATAGVALFRPPRAHAWKVFAAVVLVSLPSAAVLSRMPMYSSIHNKLWFLTVNVPLVTSLLLGLLAESAQQRVPRERTLLVVLAAGLLGLDLFAWPAGQCAAPRDLEEQSDREARLLAADPFPGRTLPYPYVESDPREAFALRAAPRPSASSWMLWTASRWGVATVATLYRDLDLAVRGDDAARARAASDLRDANVRYVIERGGGGELGPLESAGVLRQVARVGEDRVLLFDHEDADVRVRPSGGGDPRPVAHQRESDTAFDVPQAPPGSYEVSEAWYPYWHASVDGAPLATHPGARGLISFEVPPGASRHVRVVYERPGYYGVFRAMSALGALLVAALLFFAPRRRV